MKAYAREGVELIRIVSRRGFRLLAAILTSLLLLPTVIRIASAEVNRLFIPTFTISAPYTCYTRLCSYTYFIAIVNVLHMNTNTNATVAVLST